MKNSWYLIAVLALGALAGPLSAPAAGATYYVDKNNTQCSNTTTSGSDTRPLCTVQYAATIAAPGDIFLIRNGRYGEGGTFTRSGTAAAPITYRAIGPNVSIGSFDDVRDENFTSTQYANVYSIPWTKACCTSYIVAQTYFPPILVDDPVNASIFTMIQQDGVMRLHPVSDFATLSVREGTWMFSGGRIYVHTYGHRVPSTAGTDLVVGHHLNGSLSVGSNVQYNTFDGFTINYAGGTGSPSFLVQGSNNRFLNLKFQGQPWALRGNNNYAENISVTHVIMRGETWEWYYSGNGSGMAVHGAGHVLKNIHIFHNWNSSISAADSTGMVIDGLRLHGAPNHCSATANNVTIRNAVFYNCQDYFYLMDTDNVLIEHTVNPSGISLQGLSAPVGRVTVRNSILSGSFGYTSASRPEHCQWESGSLLENNIISTAARIERCADGIAYPILEYISRCASGEFTGCMTIRNNRMVSDFRTVIRDGLWSAALGDSWDVHLVANSPAINAGRTSGTTHDIDGVARPQGSAPDSGIYELCSSGTCTPPPPPPPPPTSSACDINRDSLTNVMDVQLEVNQSLGFAPCTADINHDGRCDILDVQRVGNAALFGTCLSS